ncbi:MAG TPA: Holliday junction branch migration protein RuvA [Haloplasmataceae bacterium]
MYAYIHGKVKKISTDYIILDNNNIGYKIITPNPYQFVLDEVITVYTYFYIRNENQELYGFRSMQEKELFEKLISVTGIGPKSACAILAPGDITNVIDAIDKGDVNYLTKFPKVGHKTAQQIILDLKGKLGSMERVEIGKELDEASEALKALGYSDKEIQRVFKLITERDLSTQEYITRALQLMLK